MYIGEALFVRSFVCSFVRSFVCPFVCSFVRLFVCLFVRSLACSDGRTEIPPLFYRTSSPSGPLPKKGRKGGKKKKKTNISKHWG